MTGLPSGVPSRDGSVRSRPACCVARRRRRRRRRATGKHQRRRKKASRLRCCCQDGRRQQPIPSPPFGTSSEGRRTNVRPSGPARGSRLCPGMGLSSFLLIRQRGRSGAVARRRDQPAGARRRQRACRQASERSWARRAVPGRQGDAESTWRRGWGDAVNLYFLCSVAKIRPAKTTDSQQNSHSSSSALRVGTTSLPFYQILPPTLSIYSVLVLGFTSSLYVW